MRHTPDSGTERAAGEKKRFDLSVPQVAGSAIAAVVAAKLASSLGVYGTILGAGVISVIATCGGPVLQHLLKRTGEQVREVAAAPVKQPQRPQEPGEFGEPTVHGTRMRGWRRPALGAAAVFLLAMGGITAYELTSGQDLGGTKGATTFGSAVRGDDRGDHRDGGGKGEESPPSTPRPEHGGTGTPTDTPSGGGGSGTATPEPTGTPTGSPTPTPSGSTGPTDRPTTAPPPTTPPVTEPASPPATAAE